MALLKSKANDKKMNLKLKITQSVLDEAEQYSQWAELSDLSNFFEEAAIYLLKIDKEWKAKNKTTVENERNA